MKKFYKSAMFLCIVAAATLMIPVGSLSMLLGDKYGVIWSVGERFQSGGVVIVGLLLAFGAANFLGSRFTLSKKWDFVTGQLPVLMLLPAILIAVATIVGAVMLGSQSPWILVELYGGIALVLALFLGGAFLRGMSDDDRQDWEFKKELYTLRRERGKLGKRRWFKC